MIVYGNPAYEEDLPVLLTQLRRRARKARDESLDSSRAFLILAGQIEQAVEDSGPSLSCLPVIRRLTDCAAEAFLSAWRKSEGDGDLPSAHSLEGAEAELEGLAAAPPLRVEVKVPEGFAFYTLYPEQYLCAAQRWLEEHPADSGPVLVIGIRSIGTSLSALVRAVLQAAGRSVRRVTVRPSGHPFERAVGIDGCALEGATCALVVDEGPGLSGSSMASVAEALRRGGLDAGRITFLPGHAGEPGSAATEAVRAWWDRTARLVVPTPEMRWRGQTLPDLLASLSPQLAGGSEVEQVEDFGGGLWRQAAYSDLAEYPAVAAAFETPKYRVSVRGRSAVLWKFGGLAVVPGGETALDAARQRLTSLAMGGWTAPQSGGAHGFVASLWLDGFPLGVQDADERVLERIGAYLAASSRTPMGADELTASLRRAADMLYWNTRETLGERWADESLRWAERAAESLPAPIPAYGDGRMAPYKWLRLPSGSLIKLDPAGHDLDHTIVGRQPWLWDLAGAITEWELDRFTQRPLIEAAVRAGLPAPPPSALTFYRLAYLAFRTGLFSMAAGMTSDPVDQNRMLSQSSQYLSELGHLLIQEHPRL